MAQPEETRRYPAGDSDYPAHPNQNVGALPQVVPVTGQLGPYELVCELGTGGMGTVFVATRMYPGNVKRTVALKTLKSELSRRADRVEMFMNEARISARISHPYVCTVMDVGLADGVPYVAMDYLVGEPLSRVLPLVSREPSELNVACIVKIMIGLCEGLHAAHDLRDENGAPLEVVHRDISPDNLFVLYDGTVRVVDFGIACTSEHQRLGQAKTLVGKCAYMSPEQLRTLPVDRRSDVWAMGVVLWEALAGRRLFARATDLRAAVSVLEQPIEAPSRLNPHVPNALDRVVLRALERDPDKRFPSAREMARELERASARVLGAVSASKLGSWLDALFPGTQELRRRIVVAAREAAAAEKAQVVTSELLLGKNFEYDLLGALERRSVLSEGSITGSSTPFPRSAPGPEGFPPVSLQPPWSMQPNGTTTGERNAAIAAWAAEGAQPSQTGALPVSLEPKPFGPQSMPVQVPRATPAALTPTAVPMEANASLVQRPSRRPSMRKTWVIAALGSLGGIVTTWALMSRSELRPMESPHAEVGATNPLVEPHATGATAASPSASASAPAGTPTSPPLRGNTEAPVPPRPAEPLPSPATETASAPIAPAPVVPAAAPAPAAAPSAPSAAASATETKPAPHPPGAVPAARHKAPPAAERAVVESGRVYIVSRDPTVRVVFDGHEHKPPTVLTLPIGKQVIEVQRGASAPTKSRVFIERDKVSILKLD